jgi:hypothetical protein
MAYSLGVQVRSEARSGDGLEPSAQRRGATVKLLHVDGLRGDAGREAPLERVQQACQREQHHGGAQVVPRALAPAWGAAGASSAGRGIRGCVKVGGGVSRVGVVGGCAVRRLLSQQVGFRVSPLFWSSRVLGGRIWASGGEFGENGIPGAPVGSDTKALISNLAGEQPTLTMVPLVHW